MTVRYYSSVASEKTLTGTITSGQTTMVVSNTTGLPSLTPYTLAVDYETISEELVNVTNVAGTTLTIQRAIDGTSASAHNAGARVRHVTSARDFTDSRTHENSANGVHGLDPAEDIVGTEKVQSLENKTAVLMTGSFRDIDINNTPAGVTSFTNTPAGGATVPWVDFRNGADTHVQITGNGNIRILNNAAIDGATNTRRMAILMADGTTERMNFISGGQLTVFPRVGTATSIGAFKAVDPGDFLSRKIIQVRDSTDTNDRAVIYAGGYADLISSNPAANTLGLRAAVAQSTAIFRITDSASTTQMQVDNTGQVEARKRLFVTNDTAAASVVMQVQGTTAQTADLQQWKDVATTTLAKVTKDGYANFSNEVTTGASVFTVGAGWTLATSVAVVKAGMATLNLAFTRTGGNIVADAGGNITDAPIGNITAAFLPSSAYGADSLVFAGTTGIGTGSIRVTASTGDATLVTWSSNGTLSTGHILQLTTTYPLPFS